MASRQLTDLIEPAKEAALSMLSDCDQVGLEILIYCTHRCVEEQAKLYRNGRTIEQIKAKADQLDREFDRPDLAQLLIDVGPQYGTRIITWAGPGQSNHQYQTAADGVPLRLGKAVWGMREGEDMALWKRYGSIAKANNFKWAGDWTRNREYPHIQLRGYNWRDQIRTAVFQ